MNTRILLLAVSIASLSSCSSVYKSGQTPDDVYYSPGRVQVARGNNSNDDEYVDVRQPKQGSNYQSYEQYQDNYRDDRFLRMSVGNPYYMNSYNSYSGFDWRYNSFYNGFNYGFSSPWNNYFAWNNFYNPYASPFSYYGGGLGGGYYGGGYGGVYYGGGGTVKYTNYAAPISRPVAFNVNSYSSRPGARTYAPNSNSYYNNNQRYNNGNSTNSTNNRSYYNNSNNNARSTYTPSTSTPGSNSNNYTPSRSYTPSSSGSSGGSSGGGGSSSGGGGGGGVSRPGRGN